MPSKIVFSKPISSILLGILLLLLCVLPCFAHEETDSSTDSEVAPLGKLNVRGAKTSTVKVLVKYPSTLANKKAVIEILLSDLATNQPITGVNITAILNYFPQIEKTKEALSNPLFANVLPTEEKGNYLAEVIFPQTGRYKLTLIMSKPGLDAQVIIPNIIIPDSIPKPVENISLPKSNKTNQFITLGLIVLCSSLLVALAAKKYLKSR